MPKELGVVKDSFTVGKYCTDYADHRWVPEQTAAAPANSHECPLAVMQDPQALTQGHESVNCNRLLMAI